MLNDLLIALCDCTCALGFTGSVCDNDIDDCSSNPCENGGTCVDGVNRYTCTCAPGFTGDTCCEDIGKCRSTLNKNAKIINIGITF